MKVRHSGQWKEAESFVRQSGQWKQATPSVRHGGQWHEFALWKDTLVADMTIDDYYGYGFNYNSDTGIISPNKFEKSNGSITLIWFAQYSTEICLKYPEEITKASITVNGKERTFIVSDYYGEYTSSASGDVFSLQANNRKTVPIIVKVM